MYHAITCKIEGWTIARHDTFRDMYLDFCKQAGLKAWKEQVIPRLVHHMSAKHAQVEHPRVDVFAYSTYPIQEFLLDTVIPHPIAKLPSAAQITSFANNKAETEKLEKYGQQVIPLSIETFGRLGDHALAFIHTLTRFAKQNNRLLNLPAGSLSHKWKAQLNIHLQKTIAAAIDSALQDSFLPSAKKQHRATLTQPRHLPINLHSVHPVLVPEAEIPVPLFPLPTFRNSPLLPPSQPVNPPLLSCFDPGFIPDICPSFPPRPPGLLTPDPNATPVGPALSLSSVSPSSYMPALLLSTPPAFPLNTQLRNSPDWLLPPPIFPPPSYNSPPPLPAC